MSLFEVTKEENIKNKINNEIDFFIAACYLSDCYEISNILTEMFSLPLSHIQDVNCELEQFASTKNYNH